MVDGTKRSESSTQPEENLLTKLINYMRTKKGVILCSEIVLSTIIIICFSCSLYGRYIVVAIYELVSTLIIFIIFVLELQSTFRFINFPWTDFFRAASSCIIIFIISVVCVVSWRTDSPQLTGGVFGLLAALVYGYDAYIIITDIKSNKDQHRNVLVVSV
ncbi:proteolipid protein 2 [Colossoma macropomum]|uniref:proteolipid protein 2 n=1 Tax=Colossoma macropomum TaxID=42526 RepID=UPI001864B5A0|nr:proteolipid protein 2 [Colossoma macropomum]